MHGLPLRGTSNAPVSRAAGRGMTIPRSEVTRWRPAQDLAGAQFPVHPGITRAGVGEGQPVGRGRFITRSQHCRCQLFSPRS